MTFGEDKKRIGCALTNILLRLSARICDNDEIDILSLAWQQVTMAVNGNGKAVNGSKLRGWKHDFLERSVGGCSSYDVIAP